MQQFDKPDVTGTATPLPPRKLVHDLRNLFAVIGAAKSLLERNPGPARRAELLKALGEATRQGAQLTTDLLASREAGPQWREVDLNERLAQLAPMLRVLVTARITLAGHGHGDRLVIRTVPADLDAAVLELVSNASRAGASQVTIRSRKSGGRIWLMVSDNGCGMSQPTLDRARRGRDLGLAHGSGISRVQQFMATCSGHMRIRSRVGYGTTMALLFPAIADRPAAGAAPAGGTYRQLIAA